MRNLLLWTTVTAVAALLALPAATPQAAGESGEPQLGPRAMQEAHGYGRAHGAMGPGDGHRGHGPAWDGEPDWHARMHEWMEQQGVGHGYGPGHGMGYGPMGPGMMYGPSPMMGPGCHMGPGMMGPGYGLGPGMMDGPRFGRGYGPDAPNGMPPAAESELTADHVRTMLERRLARHGNPNVAVGKVETQDGRIVAEIVTKDGSLVNRFEVDPDTGRWIQAN